MFNLYGTERLTEWKKFRDTLETSESPLEDIADLWSKAPFVNPYLDPKDPESWPDPWHLILDGKMDDLAITLGMLYTMTLTQRFMGTPCEIHMSIPNKNKEPSYFLVVDKQFVLNYDPRKVVKFESLDMPTDIIWTAPSKH